MCDHHTRSERKRREGKGPSGRLKISYLCDRLAGVVGGISADAEDDAASSRKGGCAGYGASFGGMGWGRSNQYVDTKFFVIRASSSTVEQSDV